MVGPHGERSSFDLFCIIYVIGISSYPSNASFYTGWDAVNSGLKFPRGDDVVD